MDNIIMKWVGTFITGLKLAVGGLVGRVMAALGLTWVNFAFVLPDVKSWIQDRLAGAPSDVVDFLAACGVDVFVIMIVSAVVARVGLRTLTTSLAAVEGLIGGEAGT